MATDSQSDKKASVMYTVEPLLWNTSIQGTTPLRGHKIWSWKNAHIIFVSITSIEGTPLLNGHLGIQNMSNQKEDWYLYTM